MDDRLKKRSSVFYPYYIIVFVNEVKDNDSGSVQ